MKAKKSLGQNFLQDEQILQNIANSISTTKDDLIIEIGPGTGALTKYLINKNSHLICYEIDLRLKDILSKYESNTTQIIYENFLTANLEYTKNYPHTYIIANIPYYITTPIVKKALSISNLKSMSLLVQKEVAKRFTAKEHTKEYSSLTIYLNYYFDLKYLFDVKNTCFKPIPKVDSALVNFTKKDHPNKALNEELFFKLVNDAFQYKRKNLRNNLKNYNLKLIEEVLHKYNLDLTNRAEELSLDIFIELANKLF